MEDIAQPLSHSKNWPPERGWPLFIAWMGGLVVAQVLNFVVSVALFSSMTPSSYTWKMQVPSIIVAIMGHAWQAWLLFRRHPGRFAFWTLLPLLGFVSPIRTVRLAGYISLGVPLIEAAILRGVRQRAWAWILASMAGVVLIQAFNWGLFSSNGIASLQAFLTKALGGSSQLVQFATSGFFQGFWLLTESIAVAVLAWKMPSVIGSESHGSAESQQ